MEEPLGGGGLISSCRISGTRIVMVVFFLMQVCRYNVGLGLGLDVGLFGGGGELLRVQRM